MIGIIGYGMVGKAVEYGFSKTESIVSDPKYNKTTIADVCSASPDAIFVAVPTPRDDMRYSILTGVLDKIVEQNYKGLVVVKSTILAKYIVDYDIVYNPEFLTERTSMEDFINPNMLVIGGDKAQELLDLYNEYSIVDTSNTFLTTINSASYIKYMKNSFYAMKVTYMNEMYDVVGEEDWNEVTNVLSKDPWMGSHHFQVPGPDGKRGWGGNCFPKDVNALVSEFNIEILKRVEIINRRHRHSNG